MVVVVVCCDCNVPLASALGPGVFVVAGAAAGVVVAAGAVVVVAGAGAVVVAGVLAVAGFCVLSVAVAGAACVVSVVVG